ncbi:UNVERIFIED_CONTAM: hypothetical protein Slati_3114800 [Sesamum latifolium]|uniref:Uncharacterized protein n=1 Tax=Sesamum latifolium TaxID=2727402 RepID=A0AAW2UUW1_9LAMI
MAIPTDVGPLLPPTFNEEPNQGTKTAGQQEDDYPTLQRDAEIPMELEDTLVQRFNSQRA